jgi:hypothetical protein
MQFLKIPSEVEARAVANIQDVIGISSMETTNPTNAPKITPRVNPSLMMIPLPTARSQTDF